MFLYYIPCIGINKDLVVEVDWFHKGLNAFNSIADSHLGLQQKYMVQGEEIRKMRKRMHVQSQEKSTKITEMNNLQRDLDWTQNRVKILEKEIKALNNDLDSYKPISTIVVDNV